MLLPLAEVSRFRPALINLAVRLEQQGRRAEAIRSMRTDAHAQCLEFYVNLGALWISEKRPDRAVAPLQKAVELAPGASRRTSIWPAANSMLGNYAEALASYRKAIELEPDNPETLTRLSAFLDRLGTVGAAAAKRARKAALTTVVTTLPTAERMVYAGKHEGLKNENCKMQIANFGTDANNPLPEREGRIAFVSPHCIVDYSNGAATATRDGLALLAEQGFHCEAFCGTRVDGSRETSMQETFARLRVAHAARDARIGPFRGRMIFTSQGGVPVTMVDTARNEGDSPVFAYTKTGTVPCLHREEIAAFLTGCEMFLDRFRPDLVWTYGGDPVALVVRQMAKRRGAKVVFWLYNFAYSDRAALRACRLRARAQRVLKDVLP